MIYFFRLIKRFQQAFQSYLVWRNLLELTIRKEYNISPSATVQCTVPAGILARMNRSHPHPYPHPRPFRWRWCPQVQCSAKFHSFLTSSQRFCCTTMRRLSFCPGQGNSEPKGNPKGQGPWHFIS